MVSAREIEFPHVLTHGMTPFAATRSESHVVIHMAVHHQRARIPILMARGVIPDIGGFVPGRVLHRAPVGQEMIHLDTSHQFGAERDGLASCRLATARFNRATPGRYPVVNEES